jgi:peptidoglycan hydrolase CwlO-like protein
MELLDRNHYRMREDSNLLEEAKYNPTAELAIILAERLDDVLLEADTDMEEAKATAEDLRLDINQLDDKIYRLQQEIETLELMLATRDETIEELRKGTTE